MLPQSRVMNERAFSNYFAIICTDLQEVRLMAKFLSGLSNQGQLPSGSLNSYFHHLTLGVGWNRLDLILFSATNFMVHTIYLPTREGAEQTFKFESNF